MLSLYVKTTYPLDRNLIKCFPFVFKPLTLLTGISLNAYIIFFSRYTAVEGHISALGSEGIRRDLHDPSP